MDWPVDRIDMDRLYSKGVPMGKDYSWKYEISFDYMGNGSNRCVTWAKDEYDQEAAIEYGKRLLAEGHANVVVEKTRYVRKATEIWRG